MLVCVTRHQLFFEEFAVHASKKLDNLIKKKLSEIQSLKKDRQVLDVKISKCEAYIEGLGDAGKLIPKPDEDEKAALRLQPGSTIDKVYKILQAKKEPMHINDLLTDLGKPSDKKVRQATVGPINQYVRQGRIFFRDKPSVFGLLEWKRAPQGAEESGGGENGDLLEGCERPQRPHSDHTKGPVQSEAS